METHWLYMSSKKLTCFVTRYMALASFPRAQWKSSACICFWHGHNLGQHIAHYISPIESMCVFVDFPFRDVFVENPFPTVDVIHWIGAYIKENGNRSIPELSKKMRPFCCATTGKNTQSLQSIQV